MTAKSDASEMSQDNRGPLRVLMVTPIYPTEQQPHSGTFIKSQVDSLVAAGVNVEIIHPKPGPPPLRYLSAIVQIWRKARKKRFDIIHGHYGQWCFFTRLQWAIPVVASFLGDDLLGRPLGDGKYSKYVAMNVHVSRWLCKRVDAVIVKSAQMKEESRREQVSVIPNGVDFDLFRPLSREEARTELGWQRDRYYVLFGNDPDIPRKGYKRAQAAVEVLRAKGLAVELMVANGLPQTELVQYLNGSNALILPSFSEGSPNIVKEAMACNIPVVATDVGDVVELIGQTQGCSVCSPEPEDLAAGIERAIEHAGPTTGRMDISHLERSAVAKQVIAVYESVLKKRGQTS